MDSKPSKADVEARLQDAADQMSGRMESIQEEVSSSGVSIRNWMADNPLKSVGAMLAAGLAVGLAFGGSNTPSDQGTGATLDDLPGAGEDGNAERPLVVYAQDHGRKRAGLVRSLLENSAHVVFRTAVSLLVRDVIESVLADIDVDETIDADQLFE